MEESVLTKNLLVEAIQLQELNFKMKNEIHDKKEVIWKNFSSYKQIANFLSDADHTQFSQKTPMGYVELECHSYASQNTVLHLSMVHN
jgi:hypothetical protein